jgi:uncharacterized membrane protein
MGEKYKAEFKRINGYLKEVVTFFDDTGKPIGHVMNPLMIEFHPRDIMQIFVGSLLVSSPMCLTEEVWTLSENLKMENIYYLMICSAFAVILFVYFNFYRHKLKGHIIEFIKRIVAVYGVSTLSVILILFLIDKFPYETNPVVAFKRVIIIGFPTIFGAIVTDSLK